MYNVSGFSKVSYITKSVVAFIWFNHIGKFSCCLVSFLPVKVS